MKEIRIYSEKGINNTEAGPRSEGHTDGGFAYTYVVICNKNKEVTGNDWHGLKKLFLVCGIE